MKNSIIVALFLISVSSFGQNLTRSQLTNEEIQFLATDISFLTKPVQQDFDNSLSNKLVNYEFEVQLDNVTIYRGAINKPSVSKLGSQVYRRKVAFCLVYNSLDTQTKLELSENKKLQLSETEKGNKYFWTDSYELFNYDSRAKKLTVNNKLASKLEIKFFKTTY